MFRFFLGLLMLAGIAVAVAVVPVRGRTVLERWETSKGPSDFMDRSIREARAVLFPAKEKRAHRGAAATKPLPRNSKSAQPTETYSDADRKALDRLVAENAR